MTFAVSPSKLNLMEDCPRCFWLNMHKLWKRPEGIFPSLPSGMDKILKTHFDKFRDKGQLPPELCNNLHCDSMKLFGKTEKEKALLNDWRNNLKGVRWENEEGHILFGAVDNILIKDGKLIVLDYKTRGYDVKDDTPHHYQNQLDIYNFLLRKNDFQTEDYAFLLFYVPKGVADSGQVIFDTNLVKMRTDASNAEKILEKAIELLNGSCPKKTCVWCEKV